MARAAETTPTDPIFRRRPGRWPARWLRMPIDDVIAALDELIARGHLERIGGITWLLRPARRRLRTTTVIAPARVDTSRPSALTVERHHTRARQR
jgi:hypothetical protein